MKIYVGCGLTHAPDEFVEGVKNLKKLLRQKGHNVLDFVGTSVGTPRDTYLHDIEVCVASCDVVVAICDFPSTGLGMEMMAALLVYNKPVIAVADRSSKVSRLVRGIPHQKFNFLTYECLGDVVSLIESVLLARTAT